MNPLYQCFSPMWSGSVQYLWHRLALEPKRISHQEDDQGSCDLDSLDCVCLPRAAGGVGAGWKLCPIHFSHWGDVKLVLSWNTVNTDFMWQIHIQIMVIFLSSNFTRNIKLHNKDGKCATCMLAYENGFHIRCLKHRHADVHITNQHDNRNFLPYSSSIFFLISSPKTLLCRNIQSLKYTGSFIQSSERRNTICGHDVCLDTVIFVP